MENDVTVERPAPIAYGASLPFWEAAAEGRLILQRCSSGHVQFYPRSHCHMCGSTMLDWVDATGEGVLHTFSIVYRAGHEGFAGRVPYVFAIVELDEGQRVTANIVNTDVEQVHIGVPVRAVFTDQVGKYTLPQFEPAGSTSTTGEDT
jgi:uncharacterized protein